MYLNIFALVENIELQLMAIWVHLSTYLLFAIDLPSFKLFNTDSAVFRTASIKNTDLKSPDRQKQHCRCSIGKGFLKIHTCAGVSFLMCRHKCLPVNFKKHLFYRTPDDCFLTKNIFFTFKKRENKQKNDDFNYT